MWRNPQILADHFVHADCGGGSTVFVNNNNNKKTIQTASWRHFAFEENVFRRDRVRRSSILSGCK
jgi:hypothetical protein